MILRYYASRAMNGRGWLPRVESVDSPAIDYIGVLHKSKRLAEATAESVASDLAEVLLAYHGVVEVPQLEDRLR